MTKKINHILKLSVIAFILSFTTSVMAQTATGIPAVTPPVNAFGGLNVGTYNDGTGSVNSMADAVLFYQAGQTTISLQASQTDANGTAFDLYAWYKITDVNGALPAAALGETTRDLNVNDLQPGFHRFRVYGIVTSGTANCSSEEFQDIVIFVLNTLNPSVETAANAITEFCVGTTPTDPVTFTTTVDFESSYNTDLPGPAVTAFSYTYNYYAVKDGNAANRISLGTAVTGNTNTNTFNLDYSLLSAEGEGDYTIFVEVTYNSAIKDSTGKSYAVWTSQVQSNGSNYTISVTPKPGRPTITITGSSDN